MSGWLFLLVSIWCAAFTWNALRPSRNRLGFVASFFASWLTIELAEIHIVWELIVAALFVRSGALDDPVGWVALVIMGVSVAGLVVVVLGSRRTGDGLGELLAPHGAQRPFVHPRRRRSVTRHRNVEFSRVGGRRLALDVYLPEDHEPAAGERRPAILQIHGGGWVIGDKREQGIPLLKHLAANGWVGFNANYRLSPAATWPEHLIDCKQAIAWIRAHADEYGIDPDFVAVTGGSAGGHLCAMVALTADDRSLQPGFEEADCSVQAAVPFYGIYDFTDRGDVMGEEFISRFLEPLVMKAFIADEPERFRAASPMDRVHAGAPPFLVLHGDRDVLAPVQDARTFVEMLRAASTQPVVYAELAGAQHAFDVFRSTRTRHVVHGVERFLASVHERYEHGGVATEASAAEIEEAVAELAAAHASADLDPTVD